MAKPKRVVIQQTTGATLRVTVEVLREADGWHVRWLNSRVSPFSTRAEAVRHARYVAGCAMYELGIDSELIIRRVNGTVGERRTYGRDPRRVRG